VDGAKYQPGQVLPGTVYRVVRHLATGGMGSVYDVEDVTVEKRYVLKTLHPHLIAREDLSLRMRDEAKSLAKLHHPNIVDVVTAGVTTDELRAPFFVMERLVGQNLRVVLDRTRGLRLTHALKIAIDVAHALAHAHAKNLVHRDVKPENIFLHRGPAGVTITKLLDFGIVRLLDRNGSFSEGRFIGTLRYASPEQVTGYDVGPATDVYSLGAVLFEMLAGRGPFDDAGDALSIGSARIHRKAPALELYAHVPSSLDRLVARMLAKDPAARPSSCARVAEELVGVLRESLPTKEPARKDALPLPISLEETREDLTDVGMPAFVDVASERALSGLLAPTEESVPLPVAPTVEVEPPVADPLSVDREAPTRASLPRVASVPRPANDTEVALSLVELPASHETSSANAPPAREPPLAPTRRVWPLMLLGGALALTAVVVSRSTPLGPAREAPARPLASVSPEPTAEPAPTPSASSMEPALTPVPEPSSVAAPPKRVLPRSSKPRSPKPAPLSPKDVPFDP
jgi:serine/threonine protein kinase